MPERITEIKIDIVVETNKDTYTSRTFDNIKEAEEWLNSILGVSSPNRLLSPARNNEPSYRRGCC